MNDSTRTIAAISSAAARIAVFALFLILGLGAQLILRVPEAQAGLVGVCDCSWAEAQCSVHSGDVNNGDACMAEGFCSWNNVFRLCNRWMCPSGCTINSPDDCQVPNATVSFEERPGQCEAATDCGSQICNNPTAVPANATCTASCGSNYPLCNNGCDAWTCNTGFILQDGSCVAPTFSCTGTVPVNAVICTGDDAGLAADTARTVAAACGAPKCEYVCATGFVLENGSCITAPTPVFQLALTVPLEGRQAGTSGKHGSFATNDLDIRLSDATTAGSFVTRTLTDTTTTASGLAQQTFAGLVVPDGTRIAVSLKTPQHLRRTVVGTVSGNALIVNLADASTYTELDANLRKGKAFLSAGDLTGALQGERFNDNKVDPSDIATWLAAFRDAETCTDAPSTIVEDLDGNCRVGAEDLSLIIRNMNDSGDPLPA